METVKSKPLEIDDFGGMATAVDSHERNPAIVLEQINMTCVVPGQLNCRGGYREIVWDN